MSKKHVPMHGTDSAIVELSKSEPVAKLHTSNPAGCLAVAAFFELEGKTAIFLSHHPPSGDRIVAARKLEPKIRELLEKGYKPSTAAVVRPAEWHNDGSGWRQRPIQTVQPDVDGYTEALEVIPIDVTYIPDHLRAGFNTDKEWGPGTAAIQVALEGVDNTPTKRLYAEGVPVQFDNNQTSSQ